MKWRWDSLAAKSRRAAPLNTTCRWWETCQGFKSSWNRYWNTYSLSQTAFSPLIRVILYDSKVYGLKLALQSLQSLPPLFLLGFLSFPLSPPFFFFAICPSDSGTNWENTFQAPCISYPTKSSRVEAHLALEDAWRDGGHVWDLSRRPSASSPRNTIRRWGVGVWGGESPCLCL